MRTKKGKKGGRMEMNKKVKWIDHGKQGTNDGKLIKCFTVLMSTSAAIRTKWLPPS